MSMYKLTDTLSVSAQITPQDTESVSVSLYIDMRFPSFGLKLYSQPEVASQGRHDTLHGSIRHDDRLAGNPLRHGYIRLR